MTAAVWRQCDLAAWPPSIGEQQLRLSTGSSAHRLVRLISVAEPVNQAGGVSLRAERLTYVVGFVFLFAFLIWVTGFDIVRILSGGS